jgi:hypothetical protein
VCLYACLLVAVAALATSGRLSVRAAALPALCSIDNLLASRLSLDAALAGGLSALCALAGFGLSGLALRRVPSAHRGRWALVISALSILGFIFN